MRLAELRRDAFSLLDRDPGATRWPPAFEDPFPGETGLIELSSAEATPELVGGAIQHHGCALVRGLLAPDVAEHLREMVESAFVALEAHHEGEPVADTSPFYVPLEPHPDFLPSAQNTIEGRADLRWFRVCTVDAPRPMFEVIDAYENAGIGDIVRAWLGARPVLPGGGKWSLRRMPKRKISGWHQEASVFPRVPIRTINVWLTLTACGDDSPSLDVVPRRETAIHPANETNFMMLPDQVDGIIGGAPRVSPRYDPGDAMLFDEMLIHRTNTDQSMEGLRYSIESWFFAPSGHPLDLGSIVY